MVDNLMKDHLAVGRSRAEVEDLLGSQVSSRQGPEGFTISYYPMDGLTLCGGWLESCGCEELRIVYDGTMRVSGFYAAATSLQCSWWDRVPHSQRYFERGHSPPCAEESGHVGEQRNASTL